MKISAVIQNVTNRGKAVSILNLSLIIVIALTLSGCLAHSPHHDNHHDRADAKVSIEFSYYPDLHVYYDRHRHVYHYHDKYRGWLSVNILPAHIRLRGHRHHVIHSEHRAPWKSKHRYKRSHSHVDPNYREKRKNHKRKHQKKHDNSRW